MRNITTRLEKIEQIPETRIALARAVKLPFAQLSEHELDTLIAQIREQDPASAAFFDVCDELLPQLVLDELDMLFDMPLEDMPPRVRVVADKLIQADRELLRGDFFERTNDE